LKITDNYKSRGGECAAPFGADRIFICVGGKKTLKLKVAIYPSKNAAGTSELLSPLQDASYSYISHPYQTGTLQP
jgi:hypothetical protein